MGDFIGRPRFPLTQIAALSGRYQYEMEDRLVQLVPAVRDRGYLLKSDLVTLMEWKSRRPRRFIESADSALISEATAVALAAEREELRIGVLTLIPGVAFPMASVILHFFHTDAYPIIDFRALWSMNMGAPTPSYRFEQWLTYIQACRSVAREAQVDMRTLDRALWQYSKENQLPGDD